jgi:hypothetical protein
MEAVMKWIVPAVVVAALQVGFVLSVARLPEPTVKLDEVVVHVAAQAPVAGLATPPGHG